MSVTPNKPLEAGAQKIGQKIALDIPTTGPARIEPESDIEVIERPVPSTKLELLKFMEEPVTVMIHRSADKQTSAIVDVWNGGVHQAFIRGRPQVVKRKFVEVLARSREIGYSEEVFVDRSTGEAVNRMIPNEGLKYPFEVIEDKNPNGRAWLQNLLQEQT